MPVKKVSQQANIPPIIFVSSEHAAAPQKLNPAIRTMARRLNKALSRVEQQANGVTKLNKKFITNSVDKLSPENSITTAKQFKKLFQEDPSLEDFFKNIIVKAFSYGQSKDKQRTIAKLILDLAEENHVSFLAGAIYAAHGSRGSKILEDCLSEIKITGMEKFQKIFMALINSCQFNFNDQLFHQHLLSLGSFAEKALRKLGLKQNTADHLNAFYKDCLRKLYKISYESGLDKLDLDSDSNILLFEKPIFDKSLMTKDTIVSSILTLKQLWASHIMNHPRLKSSFHSSLVLLDPFTRNPFEIDIADDYTTPLNNFFVGTNVFFEPIVSLANSHKSHKKLFAQKLENILDKLFFSFDNLSHQCFKKLEIYLNTYKSLFPDQAQKYLLDCLERSSLELLPSSRQLVLYSLHSMQGARPKLLKLLMNDLANDRYENIRQLFSTAESTMLESGLDLPFLIFRDFLENAQKHKSQLWKALDALDKLDEDYFQVFFNRQTGQLEHEIFTRYNTISSQIDFKNLNQTLLLGFISYLEDRLARGLNIKPDSLDQYPKYRDFLKFVAKLPKTTSN